MKMLFRFLAVAIAAVPLALTGCGLDQHPSYSDAVKYTVRTDPILATTSTALGEERLDPDRPGVFPMFKLDDIFEPNHPYHAKLRTALQSPLDKMIEALPEGAKQIADLRDKVEKAANDEDKKKAETALQKVRIDLQEKVMRDQKNRQTLKSSQTLDNIFRDPNSLGAKERADLDAALTQAFGSPKSPTVNASVLGLEADTIKALMLDDEKLSMGSTRYRVHCLHCHGVTGDGRGPTSRWINPHPRDFRAGKFKFTSVFQVGASRPPSRGDLLRTLRHGIEGTAMPSFALLTDAELENLVSYVIHLTLRGTLEQSLIRSSYGYKDGTLQWNSDEYADPLEQLKSEAPLLVQKSLRAPDVSWRASQDPANWIKVEPYPYKEPSDPSLDEAGRKKAIEDLKASVKRGQQMFIAKPSPEFVAEYAKRLPAEIAKDIAKKAEEHAVKEKLSPKDAAADLEARLQAKATDTIKAPNCVSCHIDYGRQAKYRFDDWGTLVRPNNFTAGVFRGGKRPVDMYYRIHSGISPSGMTNFGGVLQGQDIWDLVNFVSNVSFPPMRKTLGINIP